MVKKNETEIAEKIDQSELAKLQARIAELEAEREENANRANHEAGYLKEIQSLKEKSQAKAGGITYKDIHDHRNIPLYHTNGLFVGKVVGPIHPGNAEDVFLRFAKIGIVLSMTKPTEAQIAKYKATAEFKKLDEAHTKKRLRRNKSRKESEVEKLTRVVAKMMNVDPDKLNHIKAPEEVGVK